MAAVTGFTKIKKSRFSNPELDILFSYTNIDVRKLNNPSSIRIPTSFFNEVEKIGANQIEQERNLIKSSTRIEDVSEKFCLDAQVPLKSKMVSKFGSYRKLPTGFQYFHTGLDLRAAVGTPVYAMADGDVTLSQQFVVPGNAVIINHGNGIFSKYYHLSELLVQSGQKVKKGDLIAKSGGTGRVEAPHLHWEVVWKGYPTDPMAFLDTMKSICI